MTNRTVCRSHKLLRRLFVGDLWLSCFVQGHVAMSSVTTHAVAHSERILLRNALHRLDRSVTRLTADPARNVPTVVEGDEIGQVVDLHPLDRLMVGNGCCDLLYLRRIRQHLCVTVHTR